MNGRTDRRSFLKKAAAVTVGGPLATSLANSIARGYPANSKVRHAAIGCTGMGGHDLQMLASSPHLEVVALCDIDDRHLDKAATPQTRASTLHLRGRLGGVRISVPR